MNQQATPAHFYLNAKINNIVGNNPVTKEEEIQNVALKQLPLILSEYNELLQTLSGAFNTYLVRDDIADIIVTTDGMLHRIGVTGYSIDIKGQENKKELSDILSETKLLLEDIQEYLNTCEQVTRYFIEGKCIKIIENMYSLAKLFSIDVARDQQIVFESNMSKFDKNFTTAAKSAEKYIHMGVDVVIEEIPFEDSVYFIIKSGSDQIVNGKDYPEGKFLKSINFKEPQWPELIFS